MQTFKFPAIPHRTERLFLAGLLHFSFYKKKGSETKKKKKNTPLDRNVEPQQPAVKCCSEGALTVQHVVGFLKSNYLRRHNCSLDVLLYLELHLNLQIINPPARSGGSTESEGDEEHGP